MWGKSPEGFHQTAQKCFFSVRGKNATRPFGHLSCTDFDYFWNNWLESVSRWWLAWKMSKFLRRELCRPQKRNWGCLYGAYGSIIIISGAGDRSHFRGQANVLWMCLLYWVLTVDVWFGHCNIHKTAEFLRCHSSTLTLLNFTHERAATAAHILIILVKHSTRDSGVYTFNPLNNNYF